MQNFFFYCSYECNFIKRYFSISFTEVEDNLRTIKATLNSQMSFRLRRWLNQLNIYFLYLSYSGWYAWQTRARHIQFWSHLTRSPSYTCLLWPLACGKLQTNSVKTFNNGFLVAATLQVEFVERTKISGLGEY